MVKHLTAMQESWVRSLSREYPLEKEMATYSSILAWKIPWTEEPGRLQSMGLQRVGQDWETITHIHTHTHTPPHPLQSLSLWEHIPTCITAINKTRINLYIQLWGNVCFYNHGDLRIIMKDRYKKSAPQKALWNCRDIPISLYET